MKLQSRQTPSTLLIADNPIHLVQRPVRQAHARKADHTPAHRTAPGTQHDCDHTRTRGSALAASTATENLTDRRSPAALVVETPAAMQRTGPD